MKEYQHEHYKLREYQQERYMMEIDDTEKNIISTMYSDKWEELYMKAKEESAKGKTCCIWELKWEFIG